MDIDFLLDDEKRYICSRIDKRCDLITGEAHGFAYLLDPRYLGEALEYPLRTRIEERLYDYGFNKPIEHKKQLYSEYYNFRVCMLEQKKANKWTYQMLTDGFKTIKEFWITDGTDWPLLQNVALRVFFMATSTASSERCFSTFGIIHSKHRNRLSDISVKKLVYIKTNARELDDKISELYDSKSDNE